jgi:N-acetylneuraminic acid mutarotase
MKREGSTAQAGFFNARVLIAIIICGAAACSLVSGTLVGFFSPEAPPKISHRTLTFQERVAYQRAIEEVYWRHRIWPKERPDPKPSLDVVMSQAQLERKVAEYLRNSQALEDHWQRPITAEQLQAEMDRMAQHTKQPEVLGDLFAALRSDPFVIAECLAKPVLAERSMADLSRQDQTMPFESARSNRLPGTSLTTASGSMAYTVPKISEGTPPCTDDTWTATSVINAPTARLGHTAVWTNTEMIVWGGFRVPPPTYFNTGGRYNPITDSWTATTTMNAPSARISHTAVWTGMEMIVWGGGTGSPSVSNSGGRYNPLSDSWTLTSTINAPMGREHHTAVWTGSEMIVWGGWNGTTYFNTGGRYNPSTDSWVATSTTSAPIARQNHTAVWTGSEMIVWGGYLFDGSSHWLNSGGRYNPAVDSWTATSTTNTPAGREYHTAVWTGSEMIVWGGYNDSGGSGLNTGGRYNPITDSWTATSTTNTPTARRFSTAVWADSEVIVWGGRDVNANDANVGAANDVPSGAPTPTPTATATATATPTEPPLPGTGGRYDPIADTWTPTNTVDAPIAREGHTAVWTGSQMIIWGGNGLTDGSLDTGGRYCAQSGTPTPTPTATPPATATPTPTPTAAPTARPTPIPRARPTPAPRP